MKVKDLHEILSELLEVDPEMEIIMSKDSEGNAFSPLCDWSCGIYIPESTWHGSLYDIGWSADEAYMSQEEWNKFIDENPRSIIFWPTN